MSVQECGGEQKSSNLKTGISRSSCSPNVIYMFFGTSSSCSVKQSPTLPIHEIYTTLAFAHSNYVYPATYFDVTGHVSG
jgi:hypothetical protein